MHSFEATHAASSLPWHLKGSCLPELRDRPSGISGELPSSDVVLTERDPEQLFESVSGLTKQPRWEIQWFGWC